MLLIAILFSVLSKIYNNSTTEISMLVAVVWKDSEINEK